MKKYKTVIALLFLASLITILFLCLRDKTFLQEFHDVATSPRLEVSPFPISNEAWPEDLFWQDGHEQKTFASPKATKGGAWNSTLRTFPPNFRQVGPDSNSSFRGYLDDNDLGLVAIHPETYELLPALASAWAVGQDKRTVYFKLDPDATWDNGLAVTADDYVYRLKVMRSPGIVAPWYNQYYSTMVEEVLKFDDHRIAVRLPTPVADIVERCSLRPLPYSYYGPLRKVKKSYPIKRAIQYLERDSKNIPAEYLSQQAEYKRDLKLNPATEEPKVTIEVEDVEPSWVKNHNWKIQPRTGPYNIASYIKGKEIVFKRNQTWWAKDKKFFKYRYNVDSIKLFIIRNEHTQYEYFKKGNQDQFSLILPYFWHSKAKYLSQVDRGYMQKIWFYTKKPESPLQITFNLDHPKLNNKDLRLGIIHALNVQQMIDTVLYGDYERANTFHEGFGHYTHPGLRSRRFNPAKAIDYFKKSGYIKIGPDGIRINEAGEKLSFKILYAYPHHTQRLIVLQSEARKLGLELVLDSFDPTAVFKAMLNKKHELAWHGWGVNNRPQYRGQFHQDNAHKKQNNNFSNLDNSELSQLIDAYRIGLNTEDRVRQAHEIEQKLYELAPSIPLYKVPYFRQAIWRWVKYPAFISTRSSVFVMDNYGLFWIDQKLKKDILDKMSRQEVIYDIEPLIKDERYRNPVEAR